MATKTEIKTAQIPDDVRTYIPVVINALKRALETGDFTTEIAYDIITIKIHDIKAYVDNRGVRIMYKDLDIIYRDYVAKVQVFRTPYEFPDEYYAHDYWTVLDELHDLAIKKVKERLEKVLEKI